MGVLVARLVQLFWRANFIMRPSKIPRVSIGATSLKHIVGLCSRRISFDASRDQTRALARPIAVINHYAYRTCTGLSLDNSFNI